MFPHYFALQWHFNSSISNKTCIQKPLKMPCFSKSLSTTALHFPTSPPLFCIMPLFSFIPRHFRLLVFLSSSPQINSKVLWSRGLSICWICISISSKNSTLLKVSSVCMCVYLFELLWFLNIFMRRIRNTIQMLTFFSVFWGYLFLYFRFTNQYKNIILSSSSMIKSTLLQVISFILIDVNLNEHEKIASCKWLWAGGQKAQCPLVLCSTMVSLPTLLIIKMMIK